MGQQEIYHPKLDDQGRQVLIKSPTTPSDSSTWLDLDATATFVPIGNCPEIINAVPLGAAQPSDAEFRRLAQARAFEEPDYKCPEGFKKAAGAVVVEADGRVWLIHPSNRFGGYSRTFPKGTAHGSSLRETAVREVHEETGLLVEPFAYLADSKRTESYTRYYLARRVSGTPSEMGWESQAASLAPREKLAELLDNPLDKAIVAALLERVDEWREWFSDEEWVTALASPYFANPAVRSLTSAFRILYTIDAFRVQYGIWPTRVSVDRGMLEALRTEVFSDNGWSCLTKRVHVDDRANGTVIAHDENGRTFDYADVDTTRRPSAMADVWIWGVPLAN